ncbi:MAG: hypothetical protein COW00_14825 [Bdellovibrio sp. CG12_big_fil_rev_8_21_14_0_65_39_13]|nr:MAG: hypothetical protein COW78_13925 [Bdellovibrio sp. CG22_combo_CG10-13_8_21_14_all_39_27]PIQ58568.1 MAG: hypothetical protein COW00_14825 [Bdellovibrio sp. CG12_big_fil_rev_8_21_14_0_65_39_13]PIR32449.1 MAG: hypothetical protein COV37_19780 [Bdellovibrio sp. CG11_big_fil_rev_8_21_14_0_20_39_38]
MLRCKDVVRLISSEEKLNFLQKTELKMHLLACKHCSNYNKQMNTLIMSLKKIFSVKSDKNCDQIKQLEESIIDKFIKKK